MFNELFGDLVNNIRRQRKMTMEEAGAQINISQAHWSKLERGFVPKLENINKIIQRFQLNYFTAQNLYAYIGAIFPYQIFKEVCQYGKIIPHRVDFDYRIDSIRCCAHTLPIFLQSPLYAQKFCFKGISEDDNFLKNYIELQKVWLDVSSEQSITVRIIASEFFFRYHPKFTSDEMKNQIDFILSTLKSRSKLHLRLVSMGRDFQVGSFTLYGNKWGTIFDSDFYPFSSSLVARAVDHQHFDLYDRCFDELMDQALPEEDSLALLREIQKGLQ